MLTQEVMGYVALWILWGNTLLVGIVAAKRALILLRRTTWMRETSIEDGRVGLFRAVVRSEGAIAELSIEQNGRRAGGSARAVVWHDRSAQSRVHGGTLTLANGAILKVRSAQRAAETWLSSAEVHACAQRGTGSNFEETYASALCVKGLPRTVIAPITSEREVYVAGRVVKEREGYALDAYEGRLVVSTIDPVKWARRRAAFALGVFVPGIVACAGACTFLALTEPVFEGFASKLGGFLGLLFFLLVLPAGTVLRDFMIEPHLRFVRGRWSAPSREGTQSAAA